MKVRNLHTGKVRQVQVPHDATLDGLPSKALGRVAVFSNRFGYETPDTLWMVRPGALPRELTSVERRGNNWCSQFNEVVPLGVDSSSAVVATTLRHNKPNDVGCPFDPADSTLAVYKPGGVVTPINLPLTLQKALPSATAARGSRILFRDFGSPTHFTIYDYAANRIVWEGNRRLTGAAELLSADTIGSSWIPDEGPGGWIERFNFRTGKAIRINVQAEGWAQFCGDRMMVRSANKVTLLNAQGKPVLVQHAAKDASLSTIACSQSYLLTVSYRGKTVRTLKSAYRLFDTRRLR